MYKAMSDRTFQEAYARARGSYNNIDWQTLSPHQLTEAIYRELRAIDAERNQKSSLEPHLMEGGGLCPAIQLQTSSKA
jgi:hypothetical protein